MFDNSFFDDDPIAEEASKGRQFMGGGYGTLLHLGKFIFVVYSGYHGINASSQFAGNGDAARFAQAVGIVLLEMTLIAIYGMAITGKITERRQTILAAATWGVCFMLAIAGIVADSQLNTDSLSGLMAFYLRWVLPVVPAAAALGGVAVHLLSPEQVQARAEAQQQASLRQSKFNARMAAQRAELTTQTTVKKMQLDVTRATALKMAQAPLSPEVQAAIDDMANQQAIAKLREMGFYVGTTGRPTGAHTRRGKGRRRVARSKQRVIDTTRTPQAQPDSVPDLVPDQAQPAVNGHSKGGWQNFTDRLHGRK